MRDQFRRLCFLGLASAMFLYALGSHQKSAPKPKFDENKILADFAKVYSGKNKPRITISVNRELGAEFSEYKVASRTQGEVTGKLQVGSKERTMPAKDGTGADIVPRNLLPGKSAAEAKRDYNAQAKATGKDQEKEKSAAGKTEEKAAATPETEAKPEPAALEAKSEAAESKELAPAKTDAADAKKSGTAPAPAEAQPETKPSGEKKAETAEPSPTQAKPGEASPETAKAPEPDVGKDGKPTGTVAESKAAEKPGAAAAGKEEKKIEPEAADKKPALAESKADQGKSGPTVTEDAKEESGASEEDVADAELEDDEDLEDVDDEDLDDEAADEESGDTVAVGMKFESVEIRSELPAAERESFFSEGMLWKFQNAFMAPFLEAKVKIVDRTTIVRQAGLEELKGKSTKDIDRVAIEMNALNKYTDVYLEILIAKDLNSGSGYVFKADAKDFKTGELIAYATHEGIVKEETKNVILNPTTGKSVKKKMKSLDVEATARNIALLLMQGMTSAWSE